MFTPYITSDMIRAKQHLQQFQYHSSSGIFQMLQNNKYSETSHDKYEVPFTNMV